MWTDNDEAVDAFAHFLKESESSITLFLNKLWPEYLETKSPNLGVLFTFGKFQKRFVERCDRVSGEELRDTLHVILNEMLNDPSSRALIERFVSDASKNIIG